MRNSTDKTTPLYSWHLANRAQLASFCGYHMPLWYSSVKTEHLAVLQTAGLFDTSHMGLVQVRGKDSRELLQLTFSRDLRACCRGGDRPLENGRCVYGVFLDRHGQTIDDAIVKQLATDNYLLIVNACMASVVSEHLQAHQADLRSVIEDWTERFGKIDLQGPASGLILSRVLANAEQIFENFPYFTFKGTLFDQNTSTVRLLDSSPLLISRSGYTGEFGFEIFVAAEATLRVWETIHAAGEDVGCIPCGLAARDSLRAGAGLPLSHQDIGPWPFANNPWTFALPLNPDHSGFTKEFLGGRALLELTETEHTLPFVGLDPRKVGRDEQTAATDSSGRIIGSVLTCATDMGIGWHDNRILSLTSLDRPPNFRPKGLVCGFVRVKNHLEPGVEIFLQDSKRRIPVRITEEIRPDRTARKPLKEMLNITFNHHEVPS